VPINSMRQLREEDVGFLDRAPKRFDFEASVAASPEDVFAAISGDPASWTWFPGLSGGSYEGPGPYGVGSKRTIRMGPTTYCETILVWDAPSRWVFRVDATTAPIARAIVEDWRVEPAPGGSIARWSLTMEPTPLFRVLSPLAPLVMGRLFRRAMRNLSTSLNR
jgi:hypothetical protein